MSNNCFPTYDGKCVSYGGRSFPSLGIEEGDYMGSVVKKTVGVKIKWSIENSRDLISALR